jgi:hypothetical protein
VVVVSDLPPVIDAEENAGLRAELRRQSLESH